MIFRRISSGLRRCVRAFGELSAIERACRVCTWLIVVFGIGLRLNGHAFRTIPFWVDEATWSLAVMNEPLAPLAMRPLGFLWAMREVAQAFVPSEFWLRFLPNVSGILAVLLMPYVARRLFGSSLARVLAVFLFALHPALIDLSKETKPYSVEVLLHLLPLVLYLRFVQTERRRYLVALLASLPLLFPFAYNIVFTYPAVLLVALHAAYRRFGRRGAQWSIASGAVCLIVSFGMYAALLRGVGGDEAASYWGGKYGVFYVAHGSVKPGEVHSRPSRLEWTALRYGDVAALPGTRREAWEPTSFVSEPNLESLKRLDHGLWVVFHLLGVGCLVLRKRWDWLLLLTLPVLGVTLANALGFWPLGAFRTNLFLCVPAILLACSGVDGLARGVRRSAAVALVVLALTVVPGFALGFDFHAHKSTWSAEFAAPQVLELLAEQREQVLKRDPLAPSVRLVLGQGNKAVLDYYRQLHPVLSRRYAHYFRYNFDESRVVRMRSRIKGLLRKEPSFWLLTNGGPSHVAIRRQVARAGRLGFERCFRAAVVLEEACLLEVVPVSEQRPQRRRGGRRAR